jgi:hypothetical protein
MQGAQEVKSIKLIDNIVVVNTGDYVVDPINGVESFR